MNNERIQAKYLIETPHSLEHAATVLAGEQSSGTFVSVPDETVELKEKFGARVGPQSGGVFGIRTGRSEHRRNACAPARRAEHGPVARHGDGAHDPHSV